MNLKCNMADGGLEGITIEGRESEHKGGTEVAAQFLVCATGGQIEKGTSGGGKHRGDTGIRRDHLVQA